MKGIISFFLWLSSILLYIHTTSLGLSWWLSGKESTYNAGDKGSIPGSGRFPGGGNGNSLQYSCLGNFIDRGAWWATGQWVAKSQTWLSKWARMSLFINQSASTVQFSFRFGPWLFTPSCSPFPVPLPQPWYLVCPGPPPREHLHALFCTSLPLSA